MDPVKEKLNLLKRLAQEKKLNAKDDANEEEESPIEDESLLVEESKASETIKEAASDVSLAASDATNMSSTTANKLHYLKDKFEPTKNTTDDKKLADMRQQQQQQQKVKHDETLPAGQVVKEETGEEKAIDNECGTSEMDKSEESPSMVIAKQPYKNFTIAQQPDSSKYISKIKDIYDGNRERASSSESANVSSSRPYFPSHHQHKFYPSSQYSKAASTVTTGNARGEREAVRSESFGVRRERGEFVAEGYKRNN